MKIILVTGTREDCFDVSEVQLILMNHKPDLVVHGDCPTGIDAAMSRQCHHAGVPQIPMPAQWERYKNSGVNRDRSAGPDRNYDMCKMISHLMVYGHTAICLAFPKGEKWSGTRDCMSKAENWGIEVKEFVIDG